MRRALGLAAIAAGAATVWWRARGRSASSGNASAAEPAYVQNVNEWIEHFDRLTAMMAMLPPPQFGPAPNLCIACRRPWQGLGPWSRANCCGATKSDLLAMVEPPGEHPLHDAVDDAAMEFNMRQLGIEPDVQ